MAMGRGWGLFLKTKLVYFSIRNDRNWIETTLPPPTHTEDHTHTLSKFQGSYLTPLGYLPVVLPIQPPVKGFILISVSCNICNMEYPVVRMGLCNIEK